MKNFGWLPGNEFGSPVYGVPDRIMEIEVDILPGPIYLDIPWICDQLETSACVGNMVQGAIGCQVFNAGIDRISNDCFYRNEWKLSRFFAYYFSRKYHSDVIKDTGTYIKTVLHAIRKYGLPPEKYWPYLLDKINTQPSIDAMVESDNLRGLSYYEIPENDKVDGTRRCLCDRKPVMFGTYINREFTLTDGFEILEPAKDGEPTSGHAMYCNGWGYNESDPYFDIVSSWGTKFGNLGSCRVSPDFIENCQDLSIIDNI